MKRLLIAISLIILLINPHSAWANSEEENESPPEEESSEFNRTIEDINNYFGSLGNGVVAGLELEEKFNRDLESYYEEYNNWSNNDFASTCASIQMISASFASACEATLTGSVANELALTFLESQLGVDRGTIGFLGNFFDVDLANGRITTQDVETIAGNLLGINVRGRECPLGLRIVAGACEDDTRLPIIVTRESTEAREENKASGDLRTLSQPTHLLLNENTLKGEIAPNIKTQLANLYDREIARNVAYGFVEQRGQEWIGDNLLDNYLIAEESDELYKEIHKLAGESLNLTVTQDVMKTNNLMTERLSHLVLNQSMMSKRNNASLLSIQQENAYALQLQANISDSLDKGLRSQEAALEGTSFRSLTQPLYLPGFKY